MTPAGLITVALSFAPAGPLKAADFAGVPDDEVLTRATAVFIYGGRLRHDAETARPWFAQAADEYDELWRRGFHNPALARNRARAHQLSGNLPGAVAAYHDGLAVARYDRQLQSGLEEARSAVAYPLEGDLAAQCRPRTRATIGTRMSAAEAYLAAGLLWLLGCGGLVRFAMTRAGGWLVFAGLALAALGLLGGLWWQDWRHRDAARPVVVLKDDTVLRRGNAGNYPPRLDARLPRGTEARELLRRGGWVQVELAGGAVGWLPETAVIAP